MRYHFVDFWELFVQEVNIGSGNALVLPSNKPLLEPMLTQIYVTLLGND